MARVLVVDDDPTVPEVLLAYLGREGIEARHVVDGPSALDVAAEFDPDLVVLDLMLPGMDGFEVCRRMRAARPDLPVVMLTARGEEEDRILGLEVGADDYVTKPFSAREFVLRVQSVLRRSQGSEAPPVTAGAPAVLVDGELVVDVAAHRATLHGEPLTLTVREFDLLVHLLARPGQALGRDELMRQVWGWEYGDQSTVTVHVRRLREKIETDPSAPTRLVTVWGVGYRWDLADDADRKDDHDREAIG
jgi:DNA-binding response OmpR family regulator